MGQVSWYYSHVTKNLTMVKIAFTSIMFLVALAAVVVAVAMIPKALRSSIDFIREWRSLQAEAKQDRSEATNQDSAQN